MKQRTAWGWFCFACEAIMWPIRIVFWPLAGMFLAMGIGSALKGRDPIRRSWAWTGVLLVMSASHAFAGQRGTTPVGNWVAWFTTMIQGDVAWGIGLVLMVSCALGWWYTRGQGEGDGLNRLFMVGLVLAVLFNIDFFLPLFGYGAEVAPVWSDVFPGELP